MSQITLKICFANEIHKLSKIPTNFEGFLISIRSIFKLELPEYFNLKYEDIDGDRVMLLNDEDYQSFLDTARGLKKSAKVYIIPQLTDQSEIRRESQKYEMIEQFSSFVNNQTSELPPNFVIQELIENEQKNQQDKIIDINKCKNEELKTNEIHDSFDSSLYKLIEKNLGPQKRTFDDTGISLVSSIQVPNPFKSNNPEKTKVNDNLLNKKDSQISETCSDFSIKKVKENYAHLENKTEIKKSIEIMEEMNKEESKSYLDNKDYHQIIHEAKDLKPLIKNELIEINQENGLEQRTYTVECSKKIENTVDNYIHKLLPSLFYLIKDSIQIDLKSIDSRPNSILPEVLHKNIICNGCETNPINGIRYKCSYCLDFNYCEACEANKEHNHPFIKIKLPLNEEKPQIIEEYSKCLKSLLKNLGSLNFEERSTIKNLIEPLYFMFQNEKQTSINEPNFIPFEIKERIVNEPLIKINEPINIEEPVIQNPNIKLPLWDSEEEIFNGVLNKELQTVPDIISERDLVIYKTIEILNTGKKEWPRNLTLCTNGPIQGEEIKIEKIAPGKSILVVLSIKSPRKPGNYIMPWRFSYTNQNGNQKYFGEFIIISFEIQSTQKIIEEIKKDKLSSEKKPSENPVKNDKQTKEKESRLFYYFYF